jgi:TonB family protein
VVSLVLATLLAVVGAPDAGVDGSVADGGSSSELPPQVSCPRAPVYPESALEARVSGAVVVRLSISVEGRVTDVTVARGMSPDFDASAVEAARSCSAVAAQRDGVAVPSLAELTVQFSPPVLMARIEGEIVGELEEAVPGAFVEVEGVDVEADDKGRFGVQIPLPADGTVHVLISAEGFSRRSFVERLEPRTVRRSRYALLKKKVFESEVRSNRLLRDLPDPDRTPTVSHFSLTRTDIDATPGALEDLARVVQTLPGVSADPDLLASFFVRGGAPEETVYYLDGVPLSNPFHLGGFASVFNPLLIEGADFYAGGAPGAFVPALSGVLDVRYATGETQRPRAIVDLSMNTAKARLDVPLAEGLSFVASARRSYFELYFALLRSFGIVGADYVAPDIGEYFARLHYRRGRHQTTATYLHARDGLSFLIRPGEELLVEFAGGLSLSNRLDLVSLRHVVDLSGGSELSLTVAGVRDESHASVTRQSLWARDALRQEVLGRVDGTWAFSERNRLKVGGSIQGRNTFFRGQVPETRSTAPWSNTPFVEQYLPNVDIRPVQRETRVALYADHTFRPVDPVTLEGSARWEQPLQGSAAEYSARAGASYTLPSLTTLKLSASSASQRPSDPLRLDDTFGNPRLASERVVQAVLGVEQPLPFEALLRVEAYSKWLRSLAVNPDDPTVLADRLAAGLSAFESTGSGVSRGIDAMLWGRTPRTSYGLGVAVGFAERSNPLALGSGTYPTPWAQQLTLSGTWAWTPGNQWRLSAKAAFHTGRAYSEVTAFTRDEANARFLPVFGATNAALYPAFYELSVRVDKRFQWGPVEMTWYAEVLNVTNAQNVFAWTYDAGDFANNTPPEQGRFNHLPIRPFLGLRGEY